MYKSINQFFTEPDTDLTKDGSVDVLGFQMIWTFFGQQIFNNRLTTVSFDIRNYTINLLHYHLLFSLDISEINLAIKKFEVFKSDYDVKAGLLIFLEDLLVYSLLKQKDVEGIRILGLLGSYNGQKNLDNPDKRILLEANKDDSGILVRQIQLGINGRYKGPFMAMGLIDRQLNRRGDWDKVSMLFENWEDAQILTRELKLTISELLKSNDKISPKIELDKILGNKILLKAYLNCFGIFKPNKMLADFWVKKLGLDGGASFSVYEILKSNKEAIISKDVIEKARNSTLDDVEKEKLNKILKVEPFLTQCTYIFYLLTNPTNHYLDSIIDKVALIAKEINLSDIEPLLKENDRLNFLYSFINKSREGDLINPRELVRQLVKYHEAIMNERSGGVWVELNGDNIKHLYSYIDKVKLEDVLNNKYWYHNYYLGALNEILNGLKD